MAAAVEIVIVQCFEDTSGPGRRGKVDPLHILELGQLFVVAIADHHGLVIVEEGRPQLVHAARSGLEGAYEGGTVVTVPLLEYLPRIERFAGVMVTRFDD